MEAGVNVNLLLLTTGKKRIGFHFRFEARRQLHQTDPQNFPRGRLQTKPPKGPRAADITQNPQ